MGAEDTTVPGIPYDNPGPELDKAVADKMGMVPCTGWEHMNLGSAGGPCLMATTCVHTQGACYPAIETSSIGTRIGGIPQFSKSGHPLSLHLDALPPGHLLRCDAPDKWYVFRPGGGKQPLATGSNEAHVLCLAYLEVGEPKFNDSNRFRVHWHYHAAVLGLIDRSTGKVATPADLPPGWTPEGVLYLGNVVKKVRDDAFWRIALQEDPPSAGTIMLNKPEPPGSSAEVQKWLWKLADTGVGDEVMSRVNELLKKTWNDPGTPGEDPPHRI